MSEQHQQRSAEIIKQILYITMATVTPEGKPWNSPVYSAHDSDLNFYWASDKNGQHSKNVRAHSSMFIVIYDSTVPAGTGEGVYLQGKAIELHEPADIQHGRSVLQARNGKQVTEDAWKDFIDYGVRRVYMFTPERAWMNDAEMDGSVFVRDIRVELDIEDLRKRVARLT